MRSPFDIYLILWFHSYTVTIDKVAAAPPEVRDIAWKAQARLTTRYRALTRRGKRPTVVVTAIARELAGFIWAVGRAVNLPAA